MSAQETYADTTPLLGFLVQESDSEIRVDVGGGTWIIDRADIEHMSDWENPPAIDIEGRAVQVVAKSGATLGFLQPVKVTASDRPMTLPEGFTKILGGERLRELSESWGAQYDLEVAPSDIGQSPTVCDYDDPSGFGTIVKTDDCRD